ncbi:MAG TPA: tRNA pseudouridine(13) synthase TruD, partial [Chromatiales bacterium]|nr:tRNA pseudouridine(13) synthase TruD [Chromatiales bacterium]
MLDAAELDKLRLTADFGVLPRAWGDAAATGIMRSRPEDFQVIEQLPFEPSGEGEHLFVQVRKTGQNTRWVAKRLADAAGIDYRATGYAGLKDRRAVAEQWFSLHLPGQNDPVLPEIPDVEVLQQIRHGNKLRTGALAGNRFKLVLRDCNGDRNAIVERLERISAQGAPNYFGPQRFGRDARNLELLNVEGRVGREARSFGLSALRSALFN